MGAIRIAQHRAGELQPELVAWKNGVAECTARKATPIVKCPPTAKMIAAGRNHYKTANLGEAVQFFTGKPLVNAHSAMADVKGCMDVYFAIRGRRAVEEDPRRGAAPWVREPACSRFEAHIRKATAGGRRARGGPQGIIGTHRREYHFALFNG